MQRFLLGFLFFLSCGFHSGYTETFTYERFPSNRISNDVQSFAEQFQCKSDEECQTFVLHSKCINNWCKCDINETLSSDASRCLTKAGLGSPCEDNIQCSSLLSSGGICKGGKCSCRRGYHYLKGLCWKNIGLNEKCVKNEQCFSSYEYVGMKCENTCKCRENYYNRLGSACRRVRKDGESCNLDEDCEKKSCESMRCGEPKLMKERLNVFSNSTVVQVWKNLNCLKGMFELNGKCVRELGMECTTDSECKDIDNAICLDGSICACKPVLYVASEDNRKCLRVTRGKVDDISKSSCQSDPQCGVFGPNSYCNYTRCACKDETYFEVQEKFCWVIQHLQENCTDHRDCHPSVTHAVCKNTEKGKKCICQEGYHEKGSECLPDALEVGDSCDIDEECSRIPNSFCNATKVCDCKEHHYLENGECKPGVGTTCVENEDCAHLKNTECKIGAIPIRQCLCKENHTNSENYKYCLPVANYKEPCEESFQCKIHLGVLGECKSNTCKCRVGGHYSYGMCHKSKFIGESCTTLQDCFPANDTNSVICYKGFCSCNYDYELDERKICVKRNSATNVKSYSMLLTSVLLFLAIR